MAIGKQMPQDILKYEAKFISNFSVRQCIFYSVGTVLGLAVFFSPISVSMQTRAVICAAICLPFYLWGTVKPFGQPLEKIIIPFVIDNMITPRTRVNEVHFPEFEMMRKKDQREKPAKVSPEYREIR